MSKCKRCCKEFKYQWCLDRHLRRKIPCKVQNYKSTLNESILPRNESSKLTNDCPDTSNESVLPRNESLSSPNESLQCNFCFERYSRKDKLKTHMKMCKEKSDIVRYLELKLKIEISLPENKNECRFCNSIFTLKTNKTRHLKICQSKLDYQKELELKEKEKQHPQHVTHNNNNQTINNIMLNVSAETLTKFGQENTDHITNAYLLKIIGRLGVQLPKVVSTVAKQIYCDSNKPDNKTIQITNVRSQWAKVSNGNNYELQPLGDSVKGVRNKVTDLYVERQCDEPDYFKKVNARIEKLDDLNNQNYLAKSLEEKEDQKNASKLKSEIDREIKSTIYNVQKLSSKVIQN